MSDYFHYALTQFEGQQRREELDQLNGSTTTWHIETPSWEQTCFNHEEVISLQKEAAAEGLSYRVTTCPF